MTLFATSGTCFFVVDPDLKPHTNGPNCWNAALYAVGAIKSLRFMHPDEFVYLLDRYCVETQKPSFGDLGRMYDEKDVHAFIWVNENEVYSKHSNSANQNYKKMTFETMLKDYQSKRECASHPVKAKSCFRNTTYYTCHPRMDKTQIEMQILKPLENLVFELIFSENTKFRNTDNCRSGSYVIRNQILVEMNELILGLKNYKHADLEYLEKWVISMKTQIYDSQVSSSYYRCKEDNYNEKNFLYNEVRNNLKSLIDQ